MFKFLKFLIKTLYKGLTATIGFITAMALGPGMLLLMFLYEPHRPLPELISDLPEKTLHASHVMQGRTSNQFTEGTSVTAMAQSLEAMGFEVDLDQNNAVYRRRQLDCVESYAVVWTEDGDSLRKTASLTEKDCAPLF
jgi:hypothetical protein